MKLLLVEDNEPMRRMMKSLLLDVAEQMRECDDGADALAAYSAFRPDWVLMDLRMKDVDGLTATAQITAAFPEAHVMIVTDYDDPKLRAAAWQAGAREYVLKENLFDARRILLAH